VVIDRESAVLTAGASHTAGEQANDSGAAHMPVPGDGAATDALATIARIAYG
jgi:hypothetical protein